MELLPLLGNNFVLVFSFEPTPLSVGESQTENYNNFLKREIHFNQNTNSSTVKGYLGLLPCFFDKPDISGSLYFLVLVGPIRVQSFLPWPIIYLPVDYIAGLYRDP